MRVAGCPLPPSPPAGRCAIPVSPPATCLLPLLLQAVTSRALGVQLLPSRGAHTRRQFGSQCGSPGPGRGFWCRQMTFGRRQERVLLCTALERRVFKAILERKADEWPMAALCCASAQSEHCLRLHQSITGACGDGGSSGAENLPSEFATLQLAGHAAHLPPCLPHDNPLVARTAAALPPAGVCGRSQQRRRGCRHAAAASSRRRCRRARRPSAKQP